MHIIFFVVFNSHSSISDSDAETLALRVRSDDRDALRTLFNAWFPKLVTLAYHYVHSYDVANDIVQDAFVYFWETRSQWEWQGSTFGYLQLVVRRACLKIIRKQLMEDRHHSALASEGVSPELGTSSTTTDASVSATDLWQLVGTVVATLPPRMRAVALMRWFEGVGRQETADALGVSVRTVDAQLFAAAKVVRERIKDRTR